MKRRRMMNKLKVGDKVYIRDDLIVGQHYGSDLFVSEMKKMCGKTATIKRMITDNKFLIEESDWNWTTDMIKQTTMTFKLTEESVRDLLRCPKGYVIECYDLCYSPYTIKEDGVYDKDDDQTDFIEFLRDLHEYDYEIKKESDYVVEMTLAEVCEKLGKNIKIIKE